MPHESISVHVRTLSNAVSTAKRLSNHAQLCATALNAFDEGNAALEPIVETLQECGQDLQRLRLLLDNLLSDTQNLPLDLPEISGIGGEA